MIDRFTIGDFSTNTYILTINDKSIIIDPALGFERIKDQVFQNYNIVAVLITHGHIDHIDGLKYFTNVPIYISKIEYENLTNPGYTLYGWYSETIPFDLNSMDFRLLNDNDTINIFDKPIQCILTPGHTKGGMTYLYEDTMFTGDTLFSMSIGRTDFPSGSLTEIYKSIVKLIDNYPGDTRIFPGHDANSTLKDQQQYNPYYKEAKGNF